MSVGRVSSGLAEVAYERAGTGRPVLLVHAGVADRGMWDGAFERLAEHQDVVRVDLRGFGETALPDEPFAIADDLGRVIDELDLAPATVIGASMGGRAVVDLALHAPERVAALVLVGTALSGMSMSRAAADPQMDELDDALEAAIEREDFDEAARIDVATWIVGVGRDKSQVPSAVRERAFALARAVHPLQEHDDEFEHEPDAQARLAQLRVPTLVVVGEHDRPGAHAIARFVRDHAPDARLVVMPGVAHLPPIEDPDAFVEVVADFLR